MKNKKEYEQWLYEYFNGDEDMVVECFDDMYYYNLFKGDKQC